MQLQASYLPADAGLFGNATECVLTDEHAACSHGQPVVVVGGVAHGPGDLAATLWVAPELRPLAGDPAVYETDEQIRARVTPGSRDLIERARAAGWRIG